jgi:hypothetical protein
LNYVVYKYFNHKKIFKYIIVYKIIMGGISRTLYIATIVVLLIIAAIGYALYFSAIITIPPKPTPTPIPKIVGYSGGYLNGKPVTFYYYEGPSYQCTPSTGKLFPDVSSNVNATASCEVGKPGTFPSNAIPFWVTVPAFAGLSIFGVPALGSTPEGFPTYNGKIVLTQCAAHGSPFDCPAHQPLLYSPAFTIVEEYLGIKEGYGGLPQGVLPTPAHSHIVDTTAASQNIPWSTVAVLVFDPNIWPDVITGKCYQIVPSSLSNATANCLNSLDALKRALTTTNPAIADANAKNPIWLALGKPLTQVVIPGVTSVEQIRNPNSNLAVWFAISETNIYQPKYPPVKTSLSSFSEAIQISHNELIQEMLLAMKILNNIFVANIVSFNYLQKYIED